MAVLFFMGLWLPGILWSIVRGGHKDPNMEGLLDEGRVGGKMRGPFFNE